MQQQQTPTNNNNVITIPKEYWINKDAKVIFVSDLFCEDYIGGAELTLEAIYKTSPVKVQKIHSTSLTQEMIEQNKDKIWILVNWTGTKKDILSYLVVNKCEYIVIECDYKYCRHRSEHHHIIQEKVSCNCHNEMQSGKWVEAFYKRAKAVFFMSETQRDTYISKFPNMKTWTNLKCQYSTWSKEDLDYLHTLSLNRKDNGKWAILNGTSWIKNQAATELYCKSNGMEYEVLPRLQYKDFLKKLSEYKGLVFHPSGYDTCPRLVVEAKLIGLQLDINDFVQMKYEKWFSESSLDELFQFLYKRPESFWFSIENELNLLQ